MSGTLKFQPSTDLHALGIGEAGHGDSGTLRYLWSSQQVSNIIIETMRIFFLWSCYSNPGFFFLVLRIHDQS